MFRNPPPAKSPAVKSRESPGRKKPKKSPDSAKIIKIIDYISLIDYFWNYITKNFVFYYYNPIKIGTISSSV